MRFRKIIFSIAIPLGIFWLSIVLDIAAPVKVSHDNGSDRNAMVKTADSSSNEEEAYYLAAFSEGQTTAYVGNKLYMANSNKDADDSNASAGKETNMPADGSGTEEIYESTSDSNSVDRNAADINAADNNAAIGGNMTDMSRGAAISSDQTGAVSTAADSSGIAEKATAADDGGITNSGSITAYGINTLDADINSAEDGSVTDSGSNETVLDADEPGEAPSKFANIGISIAGSYVNIRKEPNTESDVLGKLYNGAAAEIIATEDSWYLVESGGVKGYIKMDYLKTGIPDDELMKKYGVLTARVNCDGLNVREKPDIEAKKLTVIYQNEKYPIMDLLDEWAKVDIKDDNVIGYVKIEYIEIITTFKDAVSREEEQELLRLKEEERIKKETAVKYRDSMNYTDADLKLLACLVHSEAGDQRYEGKLAVANVVLNRVKSSKFPNTIKGVIYQPGQFAVVRSGSLQKQLDKYESYSTESQLLSIKAARAALEGANNIGTRMYFHTYSLAVKKGYHKKSTSVKLQDHLFW